MSGTIVQVALAVGEATGHPGDGVALVSLVSLADAGAVAAAAAPAGVAAIRLVDRAAAGRALDPTVVGAYLAGVHDRVGWITEVATTHHAPYNVARRVLSLDRETGGRVGVALLPGDGDEVTSASGPDSGASDPAGRWREFARVLTRLWESFPSAALLGDQAAGVVADPTLIRAIDHEGAYYRVAGPLDGPSSRQGRPVLVADLGALDGTTVAVSADVLVVDLAGAAGADADLTRALAAVGRQRAEVALLGRASIRPDDVATTGAGAGVAARLRAWAAEHRLDGFELVPVGGVETALATLRTLVPLLTDPAGTVPETLRAALGLPESVEVAA